MLIQKFSITCALAAIMTSVSMVPVVFAAGSLSLTPYEIGQVRKDDYVYGCFVQVAAVEILKFNLGLSKMTKAELKDVQKNAGCQIYVTDHKVVKTLHKAKDELQQRQGQDGKAYKTTKDWSLIETEFTESKKPFFVMTPALVPDLERASVVKVD
jgi:hypothetical protein